MLYKQHKKNSDDIGLKEKNTSNSERLKEQWNTNYDNLIRDLKSTIFKDLLSPKSSRASMR